MNTIKRLLSLLAVLTFMAGSAFAQTSLTTTTFSAAVADSTVTSVTVASATGITASGTGATLVFLYADGELMAVRTVNGTVIGVQRGANGTRAVPHVANALVYVVPPAAATTVDYAGTCVAASQVYLPIINIRNGVLWNCSPVNGADTAAQTTATAAIAQWQGFAYTPVAERSARVSITTQAYTILPTDYIVALTTSSLGGVAIRSFTLPSHVGLAGKMLIIKDESGAITSTTNIVLVGTIDGTHSSSINVIQMKTAFMSVGLYAGSGGWFTLWCNGGGNLQAGGGASAGCR